MLKSPEMILCAVRKIAVAALPEELVRQALLHRMIEQLGYPPALLAVEKELSQLPHLALHQTKLPKRRADILCFAKGIHSIYDLYPLLLIECKAIPLNAKVMTQVMGYNHFVDARFICVANQQEIKMGWYDPSKKELQTVPFLPKYTELIVQI